MNRDYRVRVDYHRPSGTPTSATIIVNASSASKARKEGLALVKNNPSRKVASVHKTYAVPVEESPFSKTASVGGPERPNLQQVPKRKVVHAGERVTIAIPFTGQVQHTGQDKVTITSDLEYPNGNRAKRTMPREYFEQLTGLELEPAPVPITISYYSIYPDDSMYKQATGPVRNSSYPLDRLVQLKVTRNAYTKEVLSTEIV